MAQYSLLSAFDLALSEALSCLFHLAPTKKPNINVVGQVQKYNQLNHNRIFSYNSKTNHLKILKKRLGISKFYCLHRFLLRTRNF